MEYSLIIFEKKGKIAKITLNRPEAMNALNSTIRREMSLVLDEVEKDEEIDVLILTGTGRAFCAGVDLKELSTGIMEMTEATAPTVVIERLRNLPIPTICAANGYTVTGGWELALACDIIIASENTMFADTHARVGLVAGAGLSQVLPRLIGSIKAKALSFTGNYLSAQEALQCGAVSKVVPPEELQSAAEKLAQDILSCDQFAVRKAKQVINEGMKTTLQGGLTFEALEAMRLLERVRQREAGVKQRMEQVFERGRRQVKKGD